MRVFFVVALLGALGSCTAPVDPEPPGPIEVRSLGPVVTQEIDVEGGEITLSVGETRIALRVPPTALTTPTTIGVEPVAIEGIEGVAVRFSPSGLVFELPASLVISPVEGVAPVGLTFEDGGTFAELHFPVIDEEGASISIEHFSYAAIVDAREEFERRLDAAARVRLSDVDDQMDHSAEALVELLRIVVEPAVERAGNSPRAYLVAAGLLGRWVTLVEAGGLAEEPLQIRGETFGEAINRLLVSLEATGRTLLSAYEQPRCEDVGGQVRTEIDWLVLHGFVSNAFQLLFGDVRPNGPLCAHGRIVVDGEPALTTDRTR